MHKEYFRRVREETGDAPVRPRFLDFHKLSMSGVFEYPQHRHSAYEIILVRRGPYRCTLNGTGVRLGTDQALIIKPGDLHQDHLREGQFHYVVHFELGFDLPVREATPALFAEETLPEEQVARALPAGAWEVLDQLGRETRTAGLYSSQVQDALMETLFWLLVRALPAAALSPVFRRRSEDQVFRRRLFHLFERHLDNELPVAAMARHFRISARAFSERCRRSLGASPAVAFLRFRLERARVLLLTTGLSVKEVSARLGFKSPYHFSRVCRRHLGVPPSQVRSGPTPGTDDRAPG